MKTVMKLTALCALITCQIAHGRMGTVGGGGGDCVVRNGAQQCSLLDLQEATRPEYFFPTKWDGVRASILNRLELLKSKCGNVGVSETNSRRNHLAAAAALALFGEHSDISALPKLRDSISTLAWVKSHEPLEEIMDEGTIRVEFDEKRQIAVQQDGVVSVDYELFLKLPQDEREALLMHEGLLAAVLTLYSKNVENRGTQDIRDIVSLLYDQNRDSITGDVFKNVCHTIVNSQ